MLFIDSETNLQMDTVYCDESVSKQGHRNRNEDITKRKLIVLYMYYTTQDNQEKRIKSLADLFLIINKLNLKDKSMQKTFKTSSTLSLNSILMLTFLFRE